MQDPQSKDEMIMLMMVVVMMVILMTMVILMIVAMMVMVLIMLLSEADRDKSHCENANSSDAFMKSQLLK